MPFFSRTTDKSPQPVSEPSSDAQPTLQDPTDTPQATEVPTIVEPQPQPPSASRRSSLSVYSGVANSATQEAPTASDALADVGSHQDGQIPQQHSSEIHINQLKPTGNRGFGWRSLPFLGSRKTEERKVALSGLMEQEKKRHVSDDRTKRFFKTSRSEKQAKESALIVRSLIVGPSGITPPNAKTKPVSKAKMEKVKSQLLQPKSANRVIAQLRTLPSSDQLVVVGTELAGQKITTPPSSPIHAVCLSYTDAEAYDRHFSRLKEDTNGTQNLGTEEKSVTVAAAVEVVSGVATASIAQLTSLFENLRIVSLITADFGLGQPGDGPGILSGALPTAETVLEGVQQITPQLMALGYATGKVILPTHVGVNPPTDRMSIITYWWGFELLMPPPSIKYLSSVPSITHALINFLTGVAIVHEGVREILPFIRYISNYIDTEFSMIKAQDQGSGVVCAATWIVPVALVPRPWDFPTTPNQPSLEPSPSDDEAHEDPIDEHDEDSDDEPSPTPSPAPSPPSSPPILLPPLPQHEPVFLPPNSAPPIDDTPVEIIGDVEEDVPDVNVVPPTPPAPETLRGAPEGIEVVAA